MVKNTCLVVEHFSLHSKVESLSQATNTGTGTERENGEKCFHYITKKTQ